jgi:peptidoglycan biosynthesis protein MviN/MurJ (putative lipid II flippase)
VGYAIIPSMGLNGAIISSVLTQFFSTVLVWTYTIRRTGAQLSYAPMGRLLLAAIVATGVSWPLSTHVPVAWAFVPAGMVFGVLYLSLSVVFKTWRQSDFEIFASLARKAGPRGQAVAERLSGWGHRFGYA